MSENFDYSKAYYHLFNAITTQTDRMLTKLKAALTSGMSCDLALVNSLVKIAGELNQAQIDTEEMFIEGGGAV